MVNNRVIVLTGTIIPNTDFIAKTSVNDRKNDYLKAINFYLQNTDDTLFFVENSAYDLFKDQDFQKLAENKRIHLIKNPVNKEDTKFGKGYLEFKILDDFIQKYAYDEYVKVSGRYIVTNIKELINQKNNGLVMDVHTRRKVGITSFFKVKRNFYLNFFKGLYKAADDCKGVFIEHAVFNKLENVEKSIIDPFIKTPWYEGVSGSYGGSLNRHPLKTSIRNFERKLMKCLKIKKFIIEY